MTRTHCNHCDAVIDAAPGPGNIPWPYDEFDIEQHMKSNSGTVVRVKVRFEHFGGQPFDLCYHCFGMFLGEAARLERERDRLLYFDASGNPRVTNE